MVIASPAVVTLAYLLGCINTGYYLVRLRTDSDLRERGSGTLGARNTGRVLGRGGFVVAMVGDVLKGATAVALALWAAPTAVAPNAAAVAVVLGHIYPVQLRFRGGKGLATTVGAGLALFPQVVGAALAATLAWMAATRHPVEASLVGVMALPVAAVAIGGWDAGAVAAGLISGMVLVRHRIVIAERLRARWSGAV